MSGGGLTDADARQALNEALILLTKIAGVAGGYVSKDQREEIHSLWAKLRG